MRRVLRIISYVVAGICFLWGSLYLIAAYLAQTQLGGTIELVDYLVIAFWVGLFFILGILIVFFLRRQKQALIKPSSSNVRKIRKQSKQQETPSSPERFTLTQEQKKPSTETELLKHLKVQLTLGEITKEEFERKKKELTK